MNDLTYPHVLSRLQKMFIIFVTVLGFLGILGIALTQQASAGFNCDGNNWSVADETELNSAITCYNAKTPTGEYNITFTQNISLTASTTAIDNSTIDIVLIVDGAGFTIDGQKIDHVRPFTINPNTQVTIQNCTIINGKTLLGSGGIYNNGILNINNSTITRNSGRHGGIANYGTLTITNSTLSNNMANEVGGGIYNNENLTINNTTISSNTASAGGGGVYSGHRVSGRNAMLSINGSTFIDNSAKNGGGIYNEDGFSAINYSSLYSNTAEFGGGIYNRTFLTLNESTISNNHTNFGGGGVFNSSILTITQSIISKNSIDAYGGGGIFNGSNLTINDSTISDNEGFEGGGVYNVKNLTLNKSTISGNSASNGGGIFNYNNNSDEDLITINNSTISGNFVSNNGGGIYNRADSNTFTINNSTIFGNSAGSEGGGIFNDSTITINNSIIANSGTAGDCINNNTINDGGYNLIEDNSCGFTGGSDPMLGPLQNNGGATLTHALLVGSPAIDAGDSILAIDQRGIARPQGKADDIGAFEVVFNFVYLPVVQK